MEYCTKNAVLFIIFNRPEQAFRVFNAIRRAKPKRIYIAADAPRKSVESDAMLCASCRSVIELVDWDCEVKTLFPEENLGSHTAIPNAIDWFFRHEEQGMVLEDDCLPNSGYFYFCDMLLDRYKNNSKVWWINGSNLGMNAGARKADYGFTMYPISWGWASWRRAWRKFDRGMGSYKGSASVKELSYLSGKPYIYKLYWMSVFRYAKKIPNWDYRWIYTCWRHEVISCVPSVNLISNIGFGGDATHPTKNNDPLANIQLVEFNECIKHPSVVRRSSEIDSYFDQNLYEIGPIRIIKMTVISVFPFIKNIRVFIRNTLR